MKFKIKKRYRSLEKIEKIQRVFIFSIVLCTVTGVLAFISQLFASQLFDWEPTVFRLEKELELKLYLNISVTNIPLNINVYDGDTIKIEYVNETELVIEKTDYSYIISQNPDFAFSLFAAEQLNYRLDIFLPDTAYHNIAISTASGDVNIQKLSVRELYVSGSSANISAAGMQGVVTAKTQNGNIHVGFSEFLNGSILESATGNIRVTMTEKCEPELNFYTETGSFYTDFFPQNAEYNKVRTKVTDGKLSIVKNSGTSTLNVYTLSGNLSLLKI